MKKLSCLIVFFIVVLLLTGCWSRREMNELALVTAVGIDKVENGYLVTVQVLNPGEIAGKNQTTRAAVSTFSVTGRSVFEALRKLTTKAPRKLYMAHIRMVILGEDLAREGITKVLDFLSRDHEVRTDFFIAVSREQRATDILKILTRIDKIPANKVFSSIDVSEKVWAPTKGVFLDDLISNIISEGKNPVLSGVFYKGDPSIGNDISNVEKADSPSTIILDHLAIFKEDTLVDWFNLDESKGYNYITDNIQNTVVVLPCETGEGTITLEVIQSKTKVAAENVDGNIKIKINVSSEGNIGELQCNVDVLKEAEIKKIETLYEEAMKEVMEQAIEKAKENKTDVFGFGEAVHRADPKAWKGLKKNWHDEGFISSDIVIMTDAKIRRLGTIRESFQLNGSE